MVTLYNVTSRDGYIARIDGSEDFIPDDVWPHFLELCQEYGSIVMGRKTYEALQAYSPELLAPFEALDISKIIVTTNPKFKAKSGYTIVNSPEAAITLAPNGLVSSGPALNDYLLRKNLVTKILLHEVPIAISEGIKPFDRTIDQLPPIEKSLHST
jgi:dihydrofolate reductase